MLRPGGAAAGQRAHAAAGAQTGESWNKVVRPKALGAWNLDAATRGLADLEHFVCFSSIVASLGNAGAPHSARPCFVRVWFSMYKVCTKMFRQHACWGLSKKRF
jgi:hypothetical protein